MTNSNPTSNLVTRLRDYINNVDDVQLRVEAADEIERLKRAELEMWDLAHSPAKCGHARANYKDPKYGTPEYVGDERCECCMEIERLKGELQEWRQLKKYAYSLGQRTYLELHAENERLRNGIAQWAAECSGCDGTGESAHEFGKSCADCADIRALLSGDSPSAQISSPPDLPTAAAPAGLSRPSRDAEHCDYPDCEQHNALVVQRLRAALQGFVDFQIGDYDRMQTRAAKYCELRRAARALLSGDSSAPETPAEHCGYRRIYDGVKALQARCCGDQHSRCNGCEALLELLNYPECSGNPSSCPENEGRGCCDRDSAQEASPRREYHANGTYWSGVPTVDMPCDFCRRPIMDHDPKTHACPPEKASVQRFEVRNGPTTLPCDHCGEPVIKHIGPQMICPDMAVPDSHRYSPENGSANEV